jgi:hypothetical protein
MTNTTHKQSAMCAKTLDKCPTPEKCLGANVCDRYDGHMDAKEMLRLLRDHNLHYSRQSEAAKVLEALTLSISDGSRWIPVSERLPQEGARVIGLAPELFSHGVTVVQREGRVSDPSVVLWTYEAEWVGEEGSRSYIDVTHWMPLPEAPK